MSYHHSFTQVATSCNMQVMQVPIWSSCYLYISTVCKLVEYCAWKALVGKRRNVSIWLNYVHVEKIVKCKCSVIAICLLLGPLRIFGGYFCLLCGFNQCCQAPGHLILPSRQGGGTMALHGGACIPGISPKVASKFCWSDTRHHSCMNDDELSLVPLDFWKFDMCSFGVGKKDLESMGLTWRIDRHEDHEDA